MLKSVLPIAADLGMSKVLITCDENNDASKKVIINNGAKIEFLMKSTIDILKNIGFRYKKVRFTSWKN